MELIFLSVDGMNDVTFTMKDVIYIVMIVSSALGGFFSMRITNEKQNDRMTAIEKEIAERKEQTQENFFNAKNGRKAIKLEIIDKVDKLENHVKNRIDKTQNEMKQYQEKTDSEFKEINKQMSGVKNDTTYIKGKIDLLFQKFQK